MRDLRVEVKDRGDQPVGAEDTGELGALTQVELTASGHARQRIEESILVITRTDPADVGLATTGVSPEGGAGKTFGLLAHLVGLDDGIVGALQSLRHLRRNLRALRHPPREVLVDVDLQLGVFLKQLLELRLGAVGSGGLEGGTRRVVLHPVQGKSQVAARVVGVGLYLQAHEGLAARLLVTNKRRGSTGQHGGDVDVLVKALDGQLRRCGRNKFLQGDEASLSGEPTEGARVLFQGSALGGAGSELSLAAGHALRQLFVLLFLLGHTEQLTCSLQLNGMQGHFRLVRGENIHPVGPCPLHVLGFIDGPHVRGQAVRANRVGLQLAAQQRHTQASGLR